MTVAKRMPYVSALLGNADTIADIGLLPPRLSIRSCPCWQYEVVLHVEAAFRIDSDSIRAGNIIGIGYELEMVQCLETRTD